MTEPMTPPAPRHAPTRPAASGIRRGVGTLLLAAGLVAVGGVAMVSAADPSASLSAYDGRSAAPQRGAGASGDHLCPQDQADDGDGGSAGTPTPTSVPDSDL